jgi:hypothetical protein
MNLFKPWNPAVSVAFSHQKSTRQPKDLVSICVTNFNYGNFLPDCLDSLARQTHKNLDLVIVDDKSTADDSVGVATAWLAANAARFYRATLLVHVRNQGPSEARNTAFRNALGDYVFVIDADNEAYPRAIARLYAAVIGGTFDAAYSQLEIFGDRKAIGSADIWDPSSETTTTSMSWGSSANPPGKPWAATAISTKAGRITISGSNSSMPA